MNIGAVKNHAINIRTTLFLDSRISENEVKPKLNFFQKFKYAKYFK